MIDTLKREYLNQMIILSDRHARRVIGEFLQYYHDDRTHHGPGQETPSGRQVQPPEMGPVKSRPILGGLRY